MLSAFVLRAAKRSPSHSFTQDPRRAILTPGLSALWLDLELRDGGPGRFTSGMLDLHADLHRGDELHARLGARAGLCTGSGTRPAALPGALLQHRPGRNAD